MTEWRPIKGWESYSVSRDGQVRNERTGLILKPGKRNRLHLGVTLSVNGKHKLFNIHVLVADTFLGPKPKGHVVDHINENPEDNRAENLQYLTPQQNTQKHYKDHHPKPCAYRSDSIEEAWQAHYHCGTERYYVGSYPTRALALKASAQEIEKMMAERQRIKQTPSKAQQDGWRPIENSPKNGSRFLIPAKCRRGSYYVATVCYIGGYDSGDVWYEAATGMNHYNPTGWLPLPPSPNEGGAG